MNTITIKKTFSALLIIAATFIASNAHACNVSFIYSIGTNGHVTFTDTTNIDTVGGTQVYWNPGDGSQLSADVNPYQHVYTANGTYRVVLSVISSNGCNGQDTGYITISNVTTPCILHSSYTGIVNAHGSFSFTSNSTGTNSNTLYYWNAGDGGGFVQGTSSFSHTYLYQGYYNVTLKIEDSGSAYCVDSSYGSVLAYTADSNHCHLNPAFTYTQGANGHVTFTNSLNNPTYAYSFSPGDGGASFGDSATGSAYYVYTANGTYKAVLTVAYDNYPSYCSDTVSMPIVINNVTVPCTLNASFNAINDTMKGVINIVSTSTGTYSGTQYYWTPGNGATTVLEPSANFNYTYPANGTYTGKLVIKDTGSALCIDSTTRVFNISNADSLHASYTVSNTFDSIGEYVYWFTSTSTGVNDATTFAWNPGDSTAGDTAVNMPTYEHIYKDSGAHTVTLSLWFTTYPKMPHKADGSGNTRYDFTTYSATVDVGKPLGVTNISVSNSETKLYPNPNNGSFRIVVNGVANNKTAEVEITNILGELVYQTTANANNGMISKDITLPGVSNGTYFVRVITSGTVYNSKTVINR
jgi:PKD repeat protein